MSILLLYFNVLYLSLCIWIYLEICLDIFSPILTTMFGGRWGQNLLPENEVIGYFLEVNGKHNQN